jgi:hypothetical protein
VRERKGGGAGREGRRERKKGGGRRERKKGGGEGERERERGGKGEREKKVRILVQ